MESPQSAFLRWDKYQVVRHVWGVRDSSTPKTCLVTRNVVHIQTSMMKPATMIVASKQWNLDLKKLEKLLATINMPEIVLLYSPEAKSPDTSQQLKHEQASEYETDNPERLLCFGQAFPNTFVFVIATGVITDV